MVTEERIRRKRLECRVRIGAKTTIGVSHSGLADVLALTPPLFQATQPTKVP